MLEIEHFIDVTVNVLLSWFSVVKLNRGIVSD